MRVDQLTRNQENIFFFYESCWLILITSMGELSYDVISSSDLVNMWILFFNYEPLFYAWNSF